jgi:hypothetical protein
VLALLRTAEFADVRIASALIGVTMIGNGLLVKSSYQLIQVFGAVKTNLRKVWHTDAEKEDFCTYP